MAAKDSGYNIKFIVELVDQTKAVFRQIAAQGQAAAADINRAMGTAQKAIGGIDGNIASLKKKQITVAGPEKDSNQAQITAFQNLKQKTTDLQGELGKLPIGIGAVGTAAIGSVAGVLAVDVALQNLSATIKESLTAFSQDKLAMDQLAVAWKNAGRSMPVAELDGYIQELAKATTYEDTAIASAARMLAVHGPITDDLMQRSMQAAADLAAFRGMGIEEAAMMLGRASEGQFMGLRRMGVALSATTLESKNFADALGDIERSLGGQAAAAAEAYHGKLQKIQIMHGEIKERIGAIFEPAAQVWAGAKLGWLEAITGEMDRSVKAGYLKEFAASLENVTRALTLAAPASQGWLDKNLEMTEQILRQSLPVLSRFWDLLKGAGEQNTQDNTDKLMKQLEAVLQAPSQMSALKLKGAIVDWEVEEKRAQAYFDTLRNLSEAGFEHQKSVVWDTAQSREQAQIAITQLENQQSLERIRIAQEEHDTLLAFAEERLSKKENEIKARYPVNAQDSKERERQEAERDQALKELNKERVEAQIAAEKKLSDAIKSEITSREQAYQKEVEKQIELQQKMRDATEETQKAITDVASAGLSEWDKLGVKLQEANNLLQKALEELPKSPERAVEIAKQAQSAFAALKQDIAGLTKNLEDTVSHFTDLQAQIRQATMTPTQKREDEKRQIEELIAKARELREAGRLPEAEAAWKEAGSKAAALAKPIEGQSGAAAQAEAQAYFNIIRAEGEETAKNRLDQAKDLNKDLEGKLKQAGDVQQQGLGAQLTTVNSHLDKLTAALQVLNATLGGVKQFAPSEAAMAKAGMTATGGMAGTTGAAGAGVPGPYGNLPEGVPPSQAWQMQSRQSGPEVGTAGRTGQTGVGETIVPWYDEDRVKRLAAEQDAINTRREKLREAESKYYERGGAGQLPMVDVPGPDGQRYVYDPSDRRYKQLRDEQAELDFSQQKLDMDKASGFGGMDDGRGAFYAALEDKMRPRSDGRGGEGEASSGQALSAASEKFDGSVAQFEQVTGEFKDAITALKEFANKALGVNIKVNGPATATVDWS